MAEKQDWWEGLSERQRRFCEAYSSNGGNASEAARVAGYKLPGTQGKENLQKPTIKAALNRLRQTETTLKIATREERQAFWTQVMMDESQRMADRLKAGELLGKSQADFLERRELSSSTTNPLRVLLEEIGGKSLGPKSGD